MLYFLQKLILLSPMAFLYLYTLIRQNYVAKFYFANYLFDLHNIFQYF